MACQSHCLSFLRILGLFPLWLLFYTVDAGQVFLEEPVNVAVIVGNPTSFKCRVNPERLLLASAMNINTMATWFRIKEGDGADAITHSREGRFFIVGDHEAGVFDLFINQTRTDDSGSSYLCLFNQTTTRTAALNLLPESWKPNCLSYPNTDVTIGQELEIVCTSDGDTRTELLWQRNGALLEGVQRSVSDKSVSLSFSEEVTTTESILFICSATIVGMRQSYVCTIGPIEILGASPSRSYIPYIIVGLLSVVVSLLFLTLLVVLFRHRQCRVCQRELPEPQTVLDMAQIQLGGPPPFYVIDGDDISLDDGVGGSPPPDVIPTIAPPPAVTVSSTNKNKSKSRPAKHSAKSKRPGTQSRPPPSRSTSARIPPQKQASGAPLRRTSSNSTLHENIDDGSKDKTVTGKKKLTMTNFRKSSSKHKMDTRQSRSSHSQAEAVRSSASASKRDKRSEEDAKSLKQLNIEKATSSSRSRAVPRTSNIVVPSPDQRTPSMNDLGDNNLDGESGAATAETQSRYKNNVGRNSRPVSQDLNNWEELKHLQIAPENPQLNVATLSGPGKTDSNVTRPSTSTAASANKPGDKIIYAELDFKKAIGLNIKPEV